LLIKDGRQVFDHACSTKEEELTRLRKNIDDLNHSIEEHNIIIGNKDNFASIQNERIDYLENAIRELKEIMENRNNEVMTKEKIIEDQKMIIDKNKKTIINQEMIIEEQKKNQSKVVEKIVYLDKNAPIGKNTNVENINVDIWQKDFRIKDSKDEGYREEIEFEIFERGKGREKIIIKNGKIVKKPEDIIVIGKHSSEGFIVKGIYRN